MYFSGIYLLILIVSVSLIIGSFFLRKKNKTNARILLVLGIYCFVFFVFYFGLFPAGLFGLLFLLITLPISSFLLGYLYKRKDKIFSTFFYRFTIFIVILYCVGLGFCMSLI